jgi:hypothetical protein
MGARRRNLKILKSALSPPICVCSARVAQAAAGSAHGSNAPARNTMAPIAGNIRAFPYSP